MRKGGDWLNECLTSLGPQQTSSHVLLLLDTLEGEWKEAGDTQDISWGYYCSIMDAQIYIKKLSPWRIE